MPQHCDIFFNAAALQEEGKYAHSVTALGYGEDPDSDVGEFWVPLTFVQYIQNIKSFMQ